MPVEDEPAEEPDEDAFNPVEDVDELEEGPDDTIEPEPLGEDGPNTREAFEDDEDEDDLLLP